MQTEQEVVLEQMRSPQAYPHSTGKIKRIETHISWVYLTGPFAYKIKKAVELPYLDFSTLERRERACRDELALNRRLAPGLYLDVVGIGGDPRKISVGGAPVLEFAVKMSQFPDDAVANQLVENQRLHAAELTALADDLAAFHQQLRPESGDSPCQRIVENLAELEETPCGIDATRLKAIREWLNTELARLAPLFAARLASGMIRECHGDLHLGNIVKLENRLIPFDCLEFSRALRVIDVIDEVAFLFMDLTYHGRKDLATSFLDRYLSKTGDYSGLKLFRIYLAHRALVRTKVAASLIRHRNEPHSDDAISRYFDVARSQMSDRRSTCIITSGLSGSGKSTIATELAPRLGAIRIRSDVERKRLHGIGEFQSSHSGLAKGIYDADATVTTYRHLADCTESALDGGFNVIVDASFINREHRKLFRSLAARMKAGFVVLNCEAPTDVLRKRILERQQQKRDASEADIDVLERQLAKADPFNDDERNFVIQVETDQPFDADRTARKIEAFGS